MTRACRRTCAGRLRHRHPRRRPARAPPRRSACRVDRGDLPADPLGLTARPRRRPPGGRAADRRARRRPRPGARRPRAHPRRARPARSATCPRPARAPPRSAWPPSAPACRRAATASSASSPPCPGEDRALNHVQWARRPRPRRVAGAAHRLRAGRGRRRAGDRRRALRLRRLRASPARSTAAPPTPARSATATSAPSCSSSLAATPRALVYGYIPELDLTGHVRGVDSASWRAQLALVDRVVEQLVAGLPDDAALAGHRRPRHARRPRRAPGSTSTSDARAGRRRPAAGRGAARPLRARRARRRGRRAGPLARGARRPGLGGQPGGGRRQRRLRPGGRRAWPPASATSSRSPAARWALTAPEREPGPSRLIGYHGSLTATELAIPLLAARGRALG